MKPINLNTKYTLHFTYDIKHGRGNLILLHHFSVTGFLLASRSRHLSAEFLLHPNTHTHMEFYAKEV
jgi:hypothetical protein